ncbi:MAG: outer membrane lipoprotein-sorting protein [Puniceicoccales bacterium]|jgi:hypothetical protein|nr:outer membrane lipoprotein-sorting protein [Puniceicoccales bacterium]
MRKKEILALALMGFGGIFCGVVRAARHKKLPPLTPTQMAEVIQKLKTGCLNWAIIFDLKTTGYKQSVIDEGKIFICKNGTEMSLRIEFGTQSFLALRKPNDKIFCSRNSPAIGPNDPILAGHPLRFGNNKRSFLALRKPGNDPILAGRPLKFGCNKQSFLALRKPNDKIFCSQNSPAIGPNDPILAGHPLKFNDILIFFLEDSILNGSAAEYRGERRVSGRNVHIIRFKKTNGQAIDIAYDPKFEVILQVEYFDGQGILTRTFKLLNFKKAQNEWFMKSIEIKDVTNAITSQLTVKKVAAGQTIPPNIFDVKNLEKPAEDPLIYINF